MKATANSLDKDKKLQKIKTGKNEKIKLDENENKKTIKIKAGKYTITERTKKVEESGVSQKKKNYVRYESKIGTEKEEDLEIIHSALKPRREEKIIQTRKKVEYLDNYQYHETKEIKDKDPRKYSHVTHRRKGDIIGGTYEQTTFQKFTYEDQGKNPKLYSSQTTKTTVKKTGIPKPSKAPSQSTYSTQRNQPRPQRAIPPPVNKNSTITTTRTQTTVTKRNERQIIPRAQSAGRRK